MPNKKISEFPVTTSLLRDDDFLINHIGTTSTVSFSTVSNTISSSIIVGLTGDTVVQKLSTNFIRKPASATGGQVLTYNGTTSTWVASAASISSNRNFAWVYFDGTRDSSGVASTSNTNRFIYRSFNISSVLRISKGVYRINFTNPASSEFYAAVGTAYASADDNALLTAIRTMSSVGITIFTGSSDNYGINGGSAVDVAKVSWIFVE